MSEIKDEFLESNEAEKGLSSVISEYISAAPCLKISYKMTAAEIKVGVKNIFLGSKRARIKRLMLICALVVIVLLFAWIISLTRTNRAHSGYDYFDIFLGICIVFFVGAIVGILLHSFVFLNKILKYIMNAMEDDEGHFDLFFYDDLLFASDFNGMSVIFYSGKDNKIIEFEEKFIIWGKGYHKLADFYYIIPKRCLNEEKIEKIREYAKKFEERYIVKKKTK